MTEQNKDELQALRKTITDYVEEHDLYLHPRRDLDQHLKSVIKKGGCPCDPRRPECPCDEVESDLEGRGACVCTMIVTKEYLDSFGYGKKS